MERGRKPKGETKGSLARPPLYLLRGTHPCPECRWVNLVYALGCSAFYDGKKPSDQFHVLSFIGNAPERIMKLLETKCPSYYFDRMEASDPAFLMNHCRCSAKIDDSSLHWDRDGAFSAARPSVFHQVKLFKLPIEGPIRVRCHATPGAGTYLHFDQAEPW